MIPFTFQSPSYVLLLELPIIEIMNFTNVRFKVFATHPPIHTPSIAILACDSLGPDTEKVGDLNKRGKRFSCDVDENFRFLHKFFSGEIF